MRKIKILSVLLVLVLMISSTTVYLTADAATKNYTAIQLTDKTTPEIISLMGGDFEIGVDKTYRTNLNPVFGPMIYIYNDKVMPGMHFYLDINNTDWKEYQKSYTNGKFPKSTENKIRKNCLNGNYSWSDLVLTGSAKLNNSVSANMKYNKLTEALGFDFDCMYINGSYLQHYVDYVSFCFSGQGFSNDLAYGQNASAELLHKNNPVLFDITVKSDLNPGFKKNYGTMDDRNSGNNLGCDMDNDGKITAADSLFILRMSVSLEKNTEELRKKADVDKDGKVTSADSLAVLRMSVGLY